jgi:hypothetical protein
MNTFSLVHNKNYSGSKVSGTVGLPAGEKKYPFCTRLNSGRVRIPPAD